MTYNGPLAASLLALLGLAGCSHEPTSVSTRERVDSCEQGRPVSLRVLRDVYGAYQAVADGDDGFLLFGGPMIQEGMVRVDGQGDFVRHFENPVDKDHWIADAVPTADGGTLLSGALLFPLETRAERHPWLTKMDADWAVQWQVPYGPPGALTVALMPLPDGGAIAVAASYPHDAETPMPVESEREVTWSRVSPQGEVAWEQRASLVIPTFVASPARLLQVVMGADELVRLAVQTASGIFFVTTDLDGKVEQQSLLQTELALDLAAITAIPDGRFAIVSNRSFPIVTMLDARGNVLWERSYERGRAVIASGISFDAQRQELLLAGWSQETVDGQATWLLATDLDGQPGWSMQRAAMDLLGTDGNVGVLVDAQGPALGSLTVAPNGTVVAAGQTSQELSYFVLGAGTCP